MRILHTILSRGFAGSERTVAQMANTQCGVHEVTLVLKRAHRNRHGVSITQWVDPRVNVVEVGNWFPRRDIARAIDAFEPDVIHAHLRRSTKLLAQIRPAAATVVTLHITVNGPHFTDMDGIICIAPWQKTCNPCGLSRARLSHQSGVRSPLSARARADRRTAARDQCRATRVPHRRAWGACRTRRDSTC